jgi:hypothetical protein
LVRRDLSGRPRASPEKTRSTARFDRLSVHR